MERISDDLLWKILDLVITSRGTHPGVNIMLVCKRWLRILHENMIPDICAICLYIRSRFRNKWFDINCPGVAECVNRKSCLYIISRFRNKWFDINRPGIAKFINIKSCFTHHPGMLSLNNKKQEIGRVFRGHGITLMNLPRDVLGIIIGFCETPGLMVNKQLRQLVYKYFDFNRIPINKLKSRESLIALRRYHKYKCNETIIAQACLYNVPELLEPGYDKCIKNNFRLIDELGNYEVMKRITDISPDIELSVSEICDIRTLPILQLFSTPACVMIMLHAIRSYNYPRFVEIYKILSQETRLRGIYEIFDDIFDHIPEFKNLKKMLLELKDSGEYDVHYEITKFIYMKMNNSIPRSLSSF